MAYLYDTLKENFGKIAISKIEIPNYISDNLKPSYGERAYQKEAFQRFILFYNEDFEGKPRNPFHLMYNMATGSGKTLIMAGLMLYLYGTISLRMVNLLLLILRNLLLTEIN
jgi:type III restriction enzyme